jgi:uncharacterized protein YndB with AHSA1/START domain
VSDATILVDSQDIIVDEVFPHTLDVVWKTLTTPAMMGRWLHMEPIGFAPIVGTRFTYQTSPAGEWDGTIHCEVLEATPYQRLSYAWTGGHESNFGYGSRLDTIVTFTLSAAETGTRVRLVHSGFVLPKNDTAFRNMRHGWTKVLKTVGVLAAAVG